MLKNQLSHRERVRLALEHKETDRIPIAMICSAVNDSQTFDQYLQKECGISIDQYFKPILDIVEIWPKYVGPPLKENEDYWGVTRKQVSYGPSYYDEIDYYPLAKAKTIDDLANYRWPLTEWFDYTSILEQIKQINATEEYCIMVKGGNIFESSWYMRGFEKSIMDMAVAPELMDFIMHKVTDFYVTHSQKVLEAAKGSVDLMFTADDVGCQTGLLMSLEMLEKHITPCHKRLNNMIHNYGIKAIYHTDGGVMEAIPLLINMGIDILQALQFDAQGMDPQVLKNKYGDKLCFQGGISVQKTLPFGTVDEVRKETLERIKVLGKDSGYILGPSHQIQYGTPPENIAALFDTAVSTKLEINYK
ncbi:MAG: uroporphyrinogen decarboxylase family protein [Planctomycetota bacterium]|jgi:uroporphyrinogen decarboxylase